MNNHIFPCSYLHFSALSKAVALKWVEALQAAGCILGDGTTSGKKGVDRLVERSASLELAPGARPVRYPVIQWLAVPAYLSQPTAHSQLIILCVHTYFDIFDVFD